MVLEMRKLMGMMKNRIGVKTLYLSFISTSPLLWVYGLVKDLEYVEDICSSGDDIARS